ncbi:MAG: sodium:solute symporter family protein [Rickettsiaceae bacterium]|nr:sodium:solute symporter family protein [Rickettsiaceae bacterium]
MIDITIVVIYLVALLIIGIRQKSKLEGFNKFSKLDDKVSKSKLMLVATIFVSTIGGGTTFGISEKAFADNIAYSYGLLFAIPVDILIAFYVVPRLSKHHGAESVGDIMHVYYGNTGRYIAGMAAILVSIGLVAAQISVSGRIFEYILQIDYLWGVVLSYGIIVAYTTIGGMRSVLFANQLQFFAIIVAIPAISIFGFYQIGLENFINSIPSEKFSFSASPDLVTTTIVATLGFAVMNLFPTFIQRALINKDSAATSNAIYIKSIIYALFIVFITLNGLIAFVEYPDVKASLALPHLIDHLIPVGIQGLVVVGLLAAVMSTADSDLNITTITLVKDFLRPLFSIQSPERMLMVARIINVLIGSLAIIISLKFTKVVNLVIFIAGFWGPVIITPLVLALFNIVISKKGLIMSCASGLITFLVWEQFFATDYNLKGVFVGTMSNLLVFMVFYVISKRPLIRHS